MTDRRKSIGPETLDLVVMLKYNQVLWNANKDNEKTYMAAIILHVDNEEQRRNACLLRGQAMQTVQEVDDSDNNK